MVKHHKKSILIFMILVMAILLSGCVSKNRAFSFDRKETEKIVINDVEITDEDEIKEISKIFARLHVEKIKDNVNEADYQYDFHFYDEEGHTIQHFLCDEWGLLYKVGKYNEFDLFDTNFYYSAQLDTDDLERILEIVEQNQTDE